MRKSSMMFLALPLVMAALILASCSGNSGYSTSPTMVGGGGGGGGTGNAVSISGFAFHPSSLTVKAGTTVTWTNNDSVTHTVTSDNGGFASSGGLTSGAKYSVMFGTAGSFPYHCSIHPTMTGTITVTP